MYRLQQAQAEAKAAGDRADKAEKTLAVQRQQIGRFAAASYQGGGDLAKPGPRFTESQPCASRETSSSDRWMPASANR